MRITAKYLNELLKEIAKLSNSATSKDEAISKNLTHYLYLEHNSIYGGYRLIHVNVESGSHCGVFGGNGCEARLKGKEMEIKLSNIIEGLEYEQRKKPKIKDSYYTSELANVKVGLTEYAPTIKVFANGNGENTKNLSLNKESAEVLIHWLTENFVK